MTDLEGAALGSTVLRQVRGLAEWVGAGRKVTPKGNLTLADARHLVAALETTDSMDREIDGRTWRTQSSEELPELNAIVIWAKAAGLVRVQSGRLVPVKKNARLLDKPLELWATLFDVFDDLVDAVCPPGYLFSLLLRGEGDAIEYEYDFGDSWDHRIELEKLMPAAPGVAYPVFVDGERACPPEDCGGSPGYADLLKTLAQPNHKDHAQLRGWLGLGVGETFDPERFTVDEANARFDATVRHRRREA